MIALGKTIPALALVAGLSLGQIVSSVGSQRQAPAGQDAQVGIHRESGNRLPLITRERLDDFGKEEYDEIQEDIRSGRMLAGLYGPVGIRLYSPRVSDGTLRSNLYLRFESDIGRRTYELAVLVTARELDQQFEWTAHEPAALKAGVEQGVIDIVKFRRSVAALPRRDAVVIQIGREALGDRAVSLKTFTEALQLFGEQNLVDIVSVFGEYASMAVLLNVFDQQLRPGQQPLLPAR
jgi:4-carboxymuconolactone decarboxylase